MGERLMRGQKRKPIGGRTGEDRKQPRRICCSETVKNLPDPRLVKLCVKRDPHIIIRPAIGMDVVVRGVSHVPEDRLRRWLGQDSSDSPLAVQKVG